MDDLETFEQYRLAEDHKGRDLSPTGRALEGSRAGDTPPLCEAHGAANCSICYWNVSAYRDKRAKFIPAIDQMRFGGRLREWLDGLRPDNPAWHVLREIAAAIDVDADDLRKLAEEHRDIAAGFEQQLSKIRSLAMAATHDCSLRAAVLAATEDFRSPRDLLRQIEEAVERLKYVVTAPHTDAFLKLVGAPAPEKDVVAIAPLMEVLAEIFGKPKFTSPDPDRADAIAGWMNAHRPLAEVMCEDGASLAHRSCPSIEAIVSAAVEEIRAARKLQCTLVLQDFALLIGVGTYLRLCTSQTVDLPVALADLAAQIADHSGEDPGPFRELATAWHEPQEIGEEAEPPQALGYLDCVVSAARRICASFDEFGPDPGVLGFEIECLEAALDGRPAPRDEDQPR